MVERVADILRHDFRAIIGSPLILELLSIYSLLYLHGGQPGSCERCHADYYNELNKTGIMKAQEYEKIKTRTLVPAWNGLMFVHKAGNFFNSETITDDQACNLLLEGQLRESDFTKLPDEWIKFSAPEPVAEPVKKVATPKKAK
jgi:hypothetical protein